MTYGFDIGAYSYPELQPAIDRLNELLALDSDATADDKLRLARQTLFVLHELVGQHISPNSPVAAAAMGLITVVLVKMQPDS